MIYPVSKFNLTVDEGDVLSEIKQIRAELNHRSDKGLLKETETQIAFGEYNVIPEGRFKLLHGDVSFDCLFKKGEGKRLFVFLSGAKTTASVEFKRWSYYNLIDGSMLNIADPMYQLNKELMLGWYYGTRTDDFRVRIVDIVKKTAALLGLENKDIVFIYTWEEVENWKVN